MIHKKAREDFEVFAVGVKRLKELEKELNSLNTRKFKQEEKDIRRKLKSVHLIPQIEREINELKAKIAGVDVRALKAELDFEQSRKLAMLENKSQELERQFSVARKGMLTEGEVKEVDSLPILKKKIFYLRDLLNKDNKSLKEEIDVVRKRKQLSDKEVKEVNSIPKLKGKINYLQELLAKEEEKINKILGAEEKIKLELVSLRKKQLSEKEKTHLGSIPHLGARISYLRKLLGEEKDRIQKIEDLEPQFEKGLNRLSGISRKTNFIGKLFGKEKKEIEELKEKSLKLPSLSQKLSKLSREEHTVLDLLGKEQTRVEELAKKTEKIPRISGKLSHIAENLEEKSAEISREAAEIDVLKQKLGYLKKLLEDKTEEIQGELKKVRTLTDKKEITNEVRQLDEKIYNLREDVYDKLVEETSESKWMIQKEKEKIREELKNLAKASAKLMQEDKEETTSQLLLEINKLKKDLENNNREIQKRMKEIEERRITDKFIKEHQKKTISRSQELGLKPKFLERIEHIDDVYNPISVREINILSPFGVQQQKKKKEIKQSSFKVKDEFIELPPMPLSEDELKFSFSEFNKFREKINPANFSSDIEMPEEENKVGFFNNSKSKVFRDIKKEVENKIPSIPIKRENIPALREREIEMEEDSINFVKPRKNRVPNKKFLEEEKYNFFLHNLRDLKDLSYYNPEIFEEIKLLKEFQKTESEKLLANYEEIIKNLVKIRTKLSGSLK